MNDTCVFCRIINGQLPAQIVWQDDDVIVITDRQPKASKHLLVIPKVHVADIVQAELQSDIDTALLRAIRAVARQVPGMEQFRLVCNTGARAGQSVFHAHMHMLAGPNIPEF